LDFSSGPNSELGPKQLTGSRGAKGPQVEYLPMPSARPLEDVITELQASGHAVSADKLQRLRVFGIASKRVGRRYYFSAQTIQRLSYLPGR
jgi:hypothetical protein